MSHNAKNLVTEGVFGQIRTLLVLPDIVLIPILAALFSGLMAYVPGSVDAVGPLFGACVTLVALALPAVGLAGPAAQDERGYWEDILKRKAQWNPAQIDSQLASLLVKLKSLWRAAIWIYVSLPFASLALLRPAPVLATMNVPGTASQPIILWQVLSGIVLGLILTAVLRLIPLTWWLLHIGSTEALRQVIRTKAPLTGAADDSVPR